MDIFAQLLVASLASGLTLFGAVYMVLHKMLAAESHRRNARLLAAAGEITLPLRLQAYERLLMLLERISLEALVLRLRLRRPDATDATNATNAELHGELGELIAAVRSEFEHNLSQQIIRLDGAVERDCHGKKQRARAHQRVRRAALAGQRLHTAGANAAGVARKQRAAHRQRYTAAQKRGGANALSCAPR
jgi:hypothetical protein